VEEKTVAKYVSRFYLDLIAIIITIRKRVRDMA